MTEAQGTIKKIEVEIAEDQGKIITLNGALKIEVSPEGNVLAHTNEGVQKKPGVAAEGEHLSLYPDAVSVFGALIELAADGRLSVATKGTVTVKLIAAANDTASAAVEAAHLESKLEIGVKMEDGTIYAGISPTTGREMFVTPKDVWARTPPYSGMARFDDLEAVTERFNSEKPRKNRGHDDWRMPTAAELNVLYLNCKKGKLKKTFNRNGGGFGDWYWCCQASGQDNAWRKRFSDGQWNSSWKHIDSRVRLVRG